MKANSATKSRDAVPSMELLGRAALEAEVLRDGLRVEAERRTGQGSGAVRRDRRALVPLPQPLGVPGQGLDVREDVVREQDRLGVLEVRAAGHGDVGVRLGEADERVLEVGDEAADDARVVAQVHAEERGHLVVAGPARAQLAAEVDAEALKEAALQRRVDVLVGDRPDERAVRHVRFELVEAREHAGQLVLGEQARLVQHARVGAGAA